MATGIVDAGTRRSVTLYPEVPVYGILIVGVEGTEFDLKPGIPHLSKVIGHAAFFETPRPGVPPINFKFNYTFERKDWAQEMLYSKKTPFTYDVRVYEKYTTIPLLGNVINGKENVRVSGSEQYGSPIYKKIGPVKTQMTLFLCEDKKKITAVMACFSDVTVFGYLISIHHNRAFYF